MLRKFGKVSSFKIWANIYHDLYLMPDILLLTDVFENFRKACLQYYKLVITSQTRHYFTIPGLSWDAMLKMTLSVFKSASGFRVPRRPFS